MLDLMNEFGDIPSPFNPQNPKQGKHLDIDNDVYQSSNAISNSGLQLIQLDPASFIHMKNAPKNPTKVGAFDLGTVIHSAVLEPDKINKFLVCDKVKGRNTKAFQDFCIEHPKDIVLTQDEYETARFSLDSVLAHPTAKEIINAKGECELSIFYQDDEFGVMRKIRPDKDLTISGKRALVDVKTTASIDDWLSTQEWKNPLFKFNYGHNAAYYLDTASKFYGVDYDLYQFLIIQTTHKFGTLPVYVMNVTRQFLESNGFFNQVRNNLSLYKYHSENGWATTLEPPIFNDEMQVSFED